MSEIKILPGENMEEFVRRREEMKNNNIVSEPGG